MQHDESRLSPSTETLRKNESNCSDRNSSSVNVQILLSRPYYRVGGKPVVGTILVRQSHLSQNNEMSVVRLRDRLASLQFTMIGLCRYDSRWFNASKIHAERNQLSSNFGLPSDYELPPHTVPFWTSNTTEEPIELLNINERNFGKWDDANPMKPIRVPSTERVRLEPRAANGRNNEIREENIYIDTNINAIETNETNTMDESHQLAYTFRINVPQHYQNAITEGGNTQELKQPHSFHGASCRCYYLIVVRLQMKESSTFPDTSTTKTIWKQHLVSILPEFYFEDRFAQPTQNQILQNPSSPKSPSEMQIMAHSNGLPTRLTSIELNQWEGRYTVNRLGSALYRNLSRGQSTRIVDPTSQRFVGMLTILGTPNDLHHGSRLTFKMDFPMSQSSLNETKCISCYQVSACLQGQEIAITSSKTSGTIAASKRTTARRYVWDTAHEMIDPESTECVALDLLVPETIPCSIQTPNVELNVQCILDIAIGTSVKGRIAYRNIHLEIPCHVRPTIHDWERSNDDEDDVSSSKQIQGTVRQLFDAAKQLRQRQSTTNSTMETFHGNDSDTINFDTSDIQTDLKLLSLHMAKICDLKPRIY